MPGTPEAAPEAAAPSAGGAPAPGSADELFGDADAPMPSTPPPQRQEPPPFPEFRIPRREGKRVAWDSGRPDFQGEVADWEDP